MKKTESLIIGLSIVFGLFLLGYTLGTSLLSYKSLERTVVVKGLAEKEVQADVVIWPISYIRASNDLAELYEDLEKDTKSVASFLQKSGFTQDEISISAPVVTDKLAQNYGNASQIKFRYSANQTLTLYTNNLHKAREVMTQISALGKAGITFKANTYQNKIEYIYTKLNDIKPSMIHEATKNARATANTFAKDSQSSLGKIKTARQGQFSIRPRDTNTPYIKKVRIVSTVEYYLVD
jgi:hypothetical protein